MKILYYFIVIFFSKEPYPCGEYTCYNFSYDTTTVIIENEYEAKNFRENIYKNENVYHVTVDTLYGKNLKATK